jgi:hypothetical protein
MSQILEIRRPSAALVKLIEAVGILLGTPKTSSAESLYRIPRPSNYETTIGLVASDFNGILLQLANLKTSHIPNDIAAELYLKMSEPGFDYEDSIKEGGLLMRELYDAVMLVLYELQFDPYRIPVRDINVLVVVSGNRSSYAAFDAAVHVFSHGVCTVATLTVENSNKSIQEFLCRDMQRRCKEHYKLPEFQFRIEPIVVQSADQIVPRLEESILANKVNTLCLGMDDCNLGLDSQSHVLMWAAWLSNVDIVFAKGFSKVRPFTATHAQRTILLYIEEPEKASEYFLKAVQFFRPGDFIVFVAVLDDVVRGDNQDTRFGLGSRSGWVSDSRAPPPPAQPTLDERAQMLNDHMSQLLQKSQMTGKVRLERRPPMTATSQVLRQTVIEESADILVLRRMKTREVIVECAQDALCTVIIVK